MENLENLKYFHELKIDDEIKKKIMFSLEYYLARACNNARRPEIIQLNHYVDEYYATDRGINKMVVLSPSKVPFPIAYYTNYSLIKKDQSKFFYINKAGNINLHPYEYIIPALLGLFADCDPSSTLYTGNLFILSIIMSGEICIELINSSMLNSNEATCVSVVFIIGILWNLSRGSITVVLDDILSSRNNIDMQICLQSISVARCSPNWFASSYVPTNFTNSLLDFMMKSLASVRKEFPGLESLQFPLFRMNPITTVLARILFKGFSTPMSIIVNEKMFKNSLGEINMIEKGCLIKEIQLQLAQLIFWSQSNQDSEVFVHELELPEELLKSIIIEFVDKESGTSNVEFVQHSQENLLSIAPGCIDKWNSQNMEMQLKSVIGVDGSRITLARIHSLSSLSSVVEALSFVFERPGLD